MDMLFDLSNTSLQTQVSVIKTILSPEEMERSGECERGTGGCY
jgi:hypothetical protein